MALFIHPNAVEKPLCIYEYGEFGSLNLPKYDIILATTRVHGPVATMLYTNRGTSQIVPSARFLANRRARTLFLPFSPTLT